MSARVMNALGASQLERTICATAGIVGTVMAHGLSPEVDPEEWPHARYVLVWGWNPMSTAPHLWRKLLDARKAGARIVVVDPFRSRTARVADEHLRPLPGTDAALGIGMMRAIVDAGPRTTRTGAARTPTATTSCWPRLADHPIEHWAAICGVAPTTIARVGREFATTRPALLRLGVGAQRHLGAPAAYSHAGLAARADRRLARPRRRLLLHPHRHGGGGERRAAAARGPAPRSGAHDQHVPARPCAHRSRARPAGEGARVLELEPGRDRARPGARARRACAARTCSRWCSSSS